MKLPVGTRIRFLRDISQGPTEETPPFTFARKGDLGTVEENKYGCHEGHMVKWDNWQHAAFGAKLGEDFESAELERGECPKCGRMVYGDVTTGALGHIC